MAAPSISFGLWEVDAVTVACHGEHVMYMGAKGHKGWHLECPG